MKALKRFSLVGCCLAAVTVLAACGGGTTAAAPAAALQAAAPATTATTAEGDQGSQVSGVSATKNDKLGTIATAQNGFTLYHFKRDSTNPPMSTCNDECAQTWPPAMASAAGNLDISGISGTVGTVTRADGSKQITLNGEPLYFYSGDKQAGDVNGQAVNSTWYAVTPSGADASAVGATSADLSAAKNPQLGNTIVDPDGFTLYAFMKDTTNPPASNCYAACAQKWPPSVITSTPTVQGVDPSIVTTITRTDGGRQLVVCGHPVYEFSGDTGPNQSHGQGVGGTWHAITPSGSLVGVMGSTCGGIAT